jgi:hypothetical protein
MASFFSSLLLCISVFNSFSFGWNHWLFCCLFCKCQNPIPTFHLFCLFILFWTLLLSHLDNLLKVRYSAVQYGQRMRLSLTPSLSDEWSRRDEPAQKKLKAAGQTSYLARSLVMQNFNLPFGTLPFPCERQRNAQCSRFLLCNLYLLRGWEEPKKPLRHFIQQNNKQPKLLNSKMSRHGDISSSEVRTLLHFPLPKTRGGASFVRVLSIDCLPLILAQANKLLFLRTM